MTWANLGNFLFGTPRRAAITLIMVAIALLSGLVNTLIAAFTAMVVALIANLAPLLLVLGMGYIAWQWAKKALGPPKKSK